MTYSDRQQAEEYEARQEAHEREIFQDDEPFGQIVPSRRQPKPVASADGIAQEPPRARTSWQICPTCGHSRKGRRYPCQCERGTNGQST